VKKSRVTTLEYRRDKKIIEIFFLPDGKKGKNLNISSRNGQNFEIN
jgi:hypothetical protein